MSEPENTLDYCDLICPHCGHRHGDMWESGLEIETDTDWECDGCGKTFTAVKCALVTYEGMVK